MGMGMGILTYLLKVEENEWHKTLKELNHENTNDCVIAILFNVV